MRGSHVPTANATGYGIRLTNSSKYPHAWTALVVKWLSERLGVPQARVTVRDTSRGGHGHCTGGQDPYVLIQCARDEYRREWKYSRMRHDVSRPARTPLESFVFIAAHELAHASHDGKAVFRDAYSQRHQPGRAHWRQRMELRIQDMAERMLNEYRDGVGALLLAKYLGVLRRESARTAAAARKAATKAEEKTSAEGRLSRIDAAEKRWQAKAKRAKNAIAKLARQRRGILAAQRRKAAACAS